MAENDPADNQIGDQQREKDKETMVGLAERLNHRCGFLSSGGSLFPAIHRRSNSGQKATEPGKIKMRNPKLLPMDCESTRLVPIVTKAMAKTTPREMYRYRVWTNKMANRSYMGTVYRDCRPSDVGSTLVREPQNQAGHIRWLNPL